MTKDVDKESINKNEEFEVDLGNERKTMDNRRMEVFVHCRLPEEDNSFHCDILKRTAKSKKEKASKTEYKINQDRKRRKTGSFRNY